MVCGRRLDAAAPPALARRGGRRVRTCPRRLCLCPSRSRPSCAARAGDVHHVAELLEGGLDVNVLVHGPHRSHLPAQGPESQLVACRDDEAAGAAE